MKKKVIRSIITLNGDEFDGDKNNVLTVEGLRTLATIRYGGGSIMPQAEIIIYGLSLEAMHKLMRIRWQDISSMTNTIRLEAGEQGGTLTRAYEGNITFAYIDTSTAPDIALRITSMIGVYESFKPANPISYQGEKSVVEAIGEIATGMGYLFENHGVSESLMMRDVTLVETDVNKIRRLCRDYEIDPYIDFNSISITPQGGARNLKIPVLTPKTGMIGYPTPTIQGVDVRALWDPSISFGGIVRIQDSIMQSTNGDWRVFGITAQLESEMPGGNWFVDIKAAHRDAKDAAISRA